MGKALFMTQILPSATDVVSGGGGSVQSVPLTAYYYLVTSKATAGNGMSFLKLLGDLLTTSDTGVTWTATLTSTFRLKLTHNSGGTRSFGFDANLGWKLGYFGTTFGIGGTREPTPTGTIVSTLSVAPGATGGTMPYTPVWLWNPDMWVSDTGPALFDHRKDDGIQTAPGSASRSPDGTASYVNNGRLTNATFFFRAVEHYYRVHPAIDTSELVHQNEDVVTWWQYGPALGRKVLFWRDQNDAVGVSSIASPASRPYAYVEYQPSDKLLTTPPVQGASGQNTNIWDVGLDFWLTERLGAPY